MSELAQPYKMTNSHLEETGLSTSSALRTTELELSSHALKLIQIHQEILRPTRS